MAARLTGYKIDIKSESQARELWGYDGEYYEDYDGEYYEDEYSEDYDQEEYSEE